MTSKWKFCRHKCNRLWRTVIHVDLAKFVHRTATIFDWVFTFFKTSRNLNYAFRAAKFSGPSTQSPDRKRKHLRPQIGI